MSQTDAGRATFSKAIETAINSYSKENGSNTPDFILAEFLLGCLRAFDDAVNAREEWYGRKGKALVAHDEIIEIDEHGKVSGPLPTGPIRERLP